MRMKTTPKRATSVSLPAEIVAEARAFGINLSQPCEMGVVAEIPVKRCERWLAENMDAIESNNAWVETNGLPLARYQMF
jgi:antitoxin CcdA